MLKTALQAFTVCLLLSCGKDPLPKPVGELRLEYPEPKYEKFSSGCGYSFEYST